MSFSISLNKLQAESESLKPEDYVVFGGSFDPVHRGHLQVLQALSELFSSVVLAPASSNPWKKTLPVALEHRVEMLKLVCRDANLSVQANPKELGISIVSSGYVYARDIVCDLREKRSGTLYWAVGEDIAESVSRWRDWPSLEVSMLVVPIVHEIHATEIREGREELHPAIFDYCRKHSLYLG